MTPTERDLILALTRELSRIIALTGHPHAAEGLRVLAAKVEAGQQCTNCRWKDAPSVCGDRSCLGASQGYRGWQP